MLIDKGLIGHWTLNGGSGATDLSSGGHNGTARGGITVGGAAGRTGKTGMATTFEGSDDYIDFSAWGYWLFRATLVTISIWIKLNTTTQTSAICGKMSDGCLTNYGQGLYYINGVLYAIGENGHVGVKIISCNLADTNWHHIVGIFTTSGKIYVDGVERASGDISESWSYYFNIGAVNSYSSNYYFNGIISDVRIYDRVLSLDEIRFLYNPTVRLSSLQSGLVCHWALDGVTFAKDLTPYGNNGTIAGSGIALGTSIDRKGHANKATTFSGFATDFIYFTSPINFTGNASIATWLYKRTGYLAFGGGNDYTEGYWFYMTGGRICNNWGNGYNYNGNSVDFNDNQWYHLAIVRSGSNSLIYKDGMLYDTTVCSTNTAVIRCVGAFYSGHSIKLAGDVNDLRIYNRALSSTEIGKLYEYYKPQTILGSDFPILSVLSGLLLWVKADSITGISDGSEVASWLDSSVNANNLTSASGVRPLYITNAVNGKPVVRFATDGSKHFYFTSGIATIRTVFWVVNRDVSATGFRFLLGHSSTYCFHSPQKGINNGIWEADWCSPYIVAGQTKLNGNIINGINTPVPTTMSILSLRTTGVVYASNMADDRDGLCPNRGWAGDIAEVIIYNRALSDAEIYSIERYLSIKYHIRVS